MLEVELKSVVDDLSPPARDGGARGRHARVGWPLAGSPVRHAGALARAAGSRAAPARVRDASASRARSSTGRDPRGREDGYKVREELGVHVREPDVARRHARATRLRGDDRDRPRDRAVRARRRDGPLRALPAHGRPRRSGRHAGADRARHRRRSDCRAKGSPPSDSPISCGATRRELERGQHCASPISAASDTMITPMPEDLHLPELARSLRAFGAAARCCRRVGACRRVRTVARCARPCRDGWFRWRAVRVPWPSARRADRCARCRRGARGRARPRARAGARGPGARGSGAAAYCTSELDALAPAPSAVVRSSPQGAAWLAQLTCVFRSADDVCMALARVLGEPVSGATRGDGSADVVDDRRHRDRSGGRGANARAARSQGRSRAAAPVHRRRARVRASSHPEPRVNSPRARPPRRRRSRRWPATTSRVASAGASWRWSPALAARPRSCSTAAPPNGRASCS